MARVKLIDPEQAEGRTHEVFERVKAYYKMVPGLQQALNYLPETTDALWTLSLNTAMEGTIREELKRVFFAVTAYEVECEYCTSPRLTDKENAAVDFARMVGRRPAGVTDEMTDKLRGLGWTDPEIVEIVASVALMRYTTTVASALDVPLEEAMEGVGVSCGVPLDRLEE
jgi:hypothetical protein